MPQPVYPPTGPQSIGQVLDLAFRIFQISLLPCLLYGVASTIAGQLPNIYFVASGRPLQALGGRSPLWWALYCAGALVALLMSAALQLRQRTIATGRPVSARAEIAEAMRRLPALVLMFIVLLIAIGVGMLALVIPGIYLMTALVLAWPALLFGGKGPLQALGYSLRLVVGNWWRTTTIFTIALVIVLVFYGIATAVMVPFVGAIDIATLTAFSAVVYVALGAIGLPFLSAIVVASYGELQVRKEGADLEQRIASVAPS